MTPEAFLTAPRAAVRWWDYLVPGRARRLQRETDASEAALVAALAKSQFPGDSITRLSVAPARIENLQVAHLRWPEPIR